MSIGSVVGFGNTAGTASNTAGSCTLPTITTDGVAYLLVGTNVATTLSSPPAGWTLVDGPRDNSAGTQRAWLYSRAVTTADSGAAVSVTFAASSRWSLGGFVAQGGDGLGVVQYWADDTVDSTLSINPITPGVGDAYRAILVQPRSNSAAYTVTPPSGWTELYEGIAGTAARWGVYVAGVQLAGQAGVEQAATTATYSGATARNIGWQFTVRPIPSAAASGSASLSGSGVLSAVGAVAVAAAVALAGSGSLGATGSPSLVRAAALSGTGSLSAQGAPAKSGTAALGGAGSLTAQGAPSTSTTVALSGSGALGATGAPGTTGTASLAGAGALTATGTPTAAGFAALGGSGQLTALNTSASALAALGGTGALTATGRPATSSTAALTGAGSLAATARPTTTTTAALSGTGTLSAATLPGVTVTLVLVGSGDLTATSLPNLATAAALTGDGTLAASGTPGPPPETAPPALGGSLQLVDPATRLVVDVDSGLSVDRFDSSLILTAPRDATGDHHMSLHVGDTKPDFMATCTSTDGPVDLASATVKVHLRKPDGTILTLTATGDGSGRVTAAWPEPLDAAGAWKAEVEVTYSDGGVQTFGPASLYVSPQIA